MSSLILAAPVKYAIVFYSFVLFSTFWICPGHCCSFAIASLIMIESTKMTIMFSMHNRVLGVINRRHHSVTAISILKVRRSERGILIPMVYSFFCQDIHKCLRCHICNVHKCTRFSVCGTPCVDGSLTKTSHQGTSFKVILKCA